MGSELLRLDSDIHYMEHRRLRYSRRRRKNSSMADFTLSAVDHIEVDGEGHISRFLPFFASSEIPRVLANINRHKAAAEHEAEPVS